jgi:hypothetical protein
MLLHTAYGWIYYDTETSIILIDVYSTQNFIRTFHKENKPKLSVRYLTFE